MATRTLRITTLLSLFAATTLGAQQVSGIVRDSVSGLAVPGAVVSVYDSAGHHGVRTISNGAGRFTVDVHPGQARLRVIRIGFEPRDVRVSASVNARAAGLEIRMLSLPALLTRVHVAGQAICPGNEDRSGTLALWDQARAGLLATVVARHTNPGQMTLLTFATDRDPHSDVVIRQTTRYTTGTSAQPFVAVNKAAGFAQSGYMARIPDGFNFFAPDADVLLDPTFAATHCFRIVSDVDHPGQVGLAFDPAPDARHPEGFVDVRGTLWIENDHPALRTLDFQYSGLASPFRDAGAGGQLVFHTMPNGLTFIQRWHMHLPAFTADVAAPVPRFMPSRQSAGWPTRDADATLRLAHWHDTGGEVLSARWPDGSSADDRMGAVTGVVQDRDGRPLAGVHAQLDGTQAEASTDSSGRFTLWPVVPGRYGLDVVDSAYAPFIDPRESSRTIQVGRDTLAVAPFEAPSRRTALSRACLDQAPSQPASVVVLGRVTGPRALLGDGALIRARFPRGAASATSAASGYSKDVRPGDDGRFVICALAPGTTLVLNLVRRDSVLADTSFTVGAPPAQVVEWRPGTGKE